MTTEARADQTPAPSAGQPRDEQAVPDHDAGIGSGEVPPDSIAAGGTGSEPAVRPQGEPDTGRDQQSRPAASTPEAHQAEDHIGGDAPPHPMSTPTHPVTEPLTAAASPAEPVPAAARDENVEQETPPVDSAPQAASAPPAAGDPLAELEAAWADIKAEVRKIAIAVHAMLTAAAPARVDGNTAVFVHPHDALVRRLSEQRSVDALRAALHTVLGREFDVRFEAGTGQTAPRGGAGTRGRGGRESGGAGSRRSGDGAAEDPAPGASEPSAPRSFSRPSAAAAAGDAPSPAEPAHPEPTAARPANARSASTPPRFSRPSQAKAAPIADDDIPPPPDYPDLPDDPGPGEYSSAPIPPPTPEEEQEMLAESARPVAPGDRQDPDEVALQLLASELGAVRLE
ncbi:hypothetical protein [Nocardia cyriacigeorgica]|uniref:hypothetical protein n=1 Tax=Nocardia cyriacigeorgica TaxID=135487 RepID=UPI002454B9F1|nr:hypothetical protein [Nocardia cyriacigeorgica]